jgi:O-antigen/teichoic acid export membrane protein
MLKAKLNSVKLNRDFIVLLLGKILQVIIALASIRILTSILSTEEIANYYLLLTLLALLSFSFFNPISIYFGRYIVSWEKTNNLLNAINVLLIVKVFSILISLLVVFILYTQLNYNVKYNLTEYMLFVFFSLLATVNGNLLSVLNTLEERIKFVKYLVVTLIVGLVISMSLVSLVDKTAVNWMYGLTISQILFSIFMYKYISKSREFLLDTVKAKITINKIKKVFYFVAPVTLVLFLEWGQSVSYRFILEFNYPLEVLAYIAVGLSVSGAIFSAVEGLVTQYFNPIYIKNITNASLEVRTRSWNMLAKYTISIYILLTIFVISLSPFLVKILVSEKFYDVYHYIMIGAIIEFFRTVTNIVFNVSVSELKAKKTIFPYISGLIISTGVIYYFNFSASLWLIPLVLAVSNCVVFVLMFYNMRKLLPISIDMKNIIRTIVLSSPLTICLLIDTRESILSSLFVILISGLYFLYSIYLLNIKDLRYA